MFIFYFGMLPYFKNNFITLWTLKQLTEQLKLIMVIKIYDYL